MLQKRWNFCIRYGRINLKLLDVLLSSEVGEAKKRQVLEDEFNIPMTETLDEEVRHMCNLSEGVLDQGRAEGRAENILSSIKKLVKNMGVSVEQAMAVLEIPNAERKKYLDLLEQ